MNGLNSLDVAIGLIFVFLVVSLVVTAINEWIAQLLALRSQTLREGIQQLLADDTLDLAAELYAHPLIKSLAHQGRFDRVINRPAAPSYIPARLFSSALLDAIPGTGTAGRPRTVAEIREAVNNLPDGSTKENLLAILNGVEGETAHARQALETWFDDAMDRVSGQYKRRIQIVTIALAFLITVLANADSFALTDHLVRNPATLAAIVALAEETAQNPVLATPEADESATGTEEGDDTSQDEGIATPEVGTVNQDDDVGNSADDAEEVLEDGTTLTPDQRDLIAQLVEQTRALQLPLGWTLCKPTEDPQCRWPQDAAGWGTKALGLVITAAAVSLGAPFWFDILSKIVRIRTTGPPPKKQDAK